MMAKILVVDDTPCMINFYVEVLESAGYHVYSARGGYEALELGVALEPDLIVTDYQMPDMDGLQLVTALRELPLFCDTPIIMRSANSDPALPQQALAAGCALFLPKQAPLTELRASVRLLLTPCAASARH